MEPPELPELPVPFTRHFTVTEPSRAQVDAFGGTTLIEFGAQWCGYCIGAQTLIETALAQHPEVRHIKISDGRGKRLGRSFRVKLWPTLVLIRDGEEVARWVRPEAAGELSKALAQPPA